MEGKKKDSEGSKLMELTIKEEKYMAFTKHKYLSVKIPKENQTMYGQGNIK